MEYGMVRNQKPMTCLLGRFCVSELLCTAVLCFLQYMVGVLCLVCLSVVLVITVAVKSSPFGCLFVWPSPTAASFWFSVIRFWLHRFCLFTGRTHSDVPSARRTKEPLFIPHFLNFAFFPLFLLDYKQYCTTHRAR